jgi:two-component system, cell cycle sensor histidine kinase and response regulator CckA
MKLKPTYEELERRVQELEKIESEYKYSKEALPESERLFKILYEKAPLGYQSLDENGHFIVVNQTWLYTLGYTREEVIGKSFADFLHPEWQDHFKENFPRFKAIGEILGVEFEMVKKNGDLILVSFTGKISSDKNGDFQQTHCIFHDITERKLAEEALQESEAKFRSIYENTAVGLAQVSLDFKIMGVNEAYCSMLGYQEKDLVGRHLKEITHLDVIEENIQKQVKLASGKIDHYRMEKKFIHKNGQTVHAILDANLIRDVSDKAIYFLGSVVDITERKQAEMDLQSQKKLLEGVLDSVKDVIGVQRPDHTIVQYNRAGYELLGLTKDQVKGKKCYELLGRQGQCDICATARSLISRTLEKVETYIPELGRHFICVSNPILDDNGNIILTIEQLTDITEKKKIDEQLNQAKKMESVGRLAGGVAHDFNNMLGVILGHTEMALEEIDPAEPLYESLQEVQHAAEHSAVLTRQLLAFARKQTAAPKVIDINDTVEGMLKMLRRLIGEDINLLWQPGRSLQPVKVDPSQIDQLLANLCVNARDAIEGVGKVTIETGAKTFDEDYCHDHLGSLPGEYVLLEVSDDGCGMDKTTLSHIFEPFFTTKEQGKGTGLGLASIYGIVKQNNGFINVYSEPDQGTTFKIYLPVYAIQSDGMMEKAPNLPTEQGNETILLVEDESVILQMTTRMLERLGYTVVAAATPGEAIRLAHEYQGRIDLLMTDVVMPEMNGRELAEKLLSHYPDLKRLFMSGYTANVIAHHGVLDQGVNFIEKPFSKKDLGEKLREALEG